MYYTIFIWPSPVGPPQTLPTGRQPFDGEGLPPSTGVRCQCKEGYNGTGVLCNGNAKETLSNMRNLSMFYQVSGLRFCYCLSVCLSVCLDHW